MNSQSPSSVRPHGKPDRPVVLTRRGKIVAVASALAIAVGFSACVSMTVSGAVTSGSPARQPAAGPAGGIVAPPPGSVDPPKPDNGLPPVVTQIKTDQKIVFITIDDGYDDNPALIEYLKETGIPVTTFLTRVAGSSHQEYFRKVSATGGSVQNHSITHTSLTSLSRSGQEQEICGTSDSYEQWYGTRPWMLRPPYGNWNQTTQEAAKACGIDYLVMWSASLPGRLLRYAHGNSLQPGDIILMHFRPTLKRDLKATVADIERQGFKIGNLQDYLPDRR